ISDNCGGIPRKVAIEKAFRMGRPEGTYDEMIETVGVYGIGMKRAIFKLGRNATVTSQHDGDAFDVTISREWLRVDEDWELPMEDAEEWDSDGTVIVVQDLYDPIKSQFDTRHSTFLEDLIKLIGR